MDCKDWGKKKEKFGKGADCKEKVKQKKSAGKEENCKGLEKAQRSFGKEDFYENEVKRQEKSGKAELCGDGVKRQQVASGGKLRQTPKGKKRATIPDRQPASVCEQPQGTRQVVPEEENDNRRRK